MKSRSKPSAVRSGGLACLLLGLLLALGCANEADDSTGGETHFLTACSANTNSCGSGLVCLCGVCTVSCAEGATCQAFPAAQCAAPSETDACSDFQAQGHCDVQCTADADCAQLSPSHRCEQGVCRAGTSTSSTGAGGSGGGPDAGGDAGDAGTNSCTPSALAANQVLIIGDSFFATTHEISADLDDLARSAGALAADASYVDDSNLTANALALAGNGIAEQYATGAADADVKVVIMNGGGADVKLGTCDTVDATCPVLVAAVSAAEDLFAQMATDGVEQVVYAFYPDPVDTDEQAKMNVLRPLIQSACASSPVPCQWIDLRPTFADNYDEYVSADGLDPTSAGSQASAAAIWATMQLNCIAQ